MNHPKGQPGRDVQAANPPMRRPRVSSLLTALLALSMVAPGPAQAQATAAAPAQAQASPQSATFKDEELDQMLAPIALYPDSLLAQVLMASTYPADFQAAFTWSKAHPDDKGDAAIAKVESQPWDPSVKSLTAFPQVLAMMGSKPEGVQRLGDAFLADPARVMDRVQFLRKKAQEAGNLKSNEQQKVSATTEASKQIIIIEPAQPQTVYVPVYQPTVVYGSWWYPSYPPYYYPPPPYYYPPGGAFVAGVFWGAAIVGISNGLWGGCNWGGGNVNINVNKYNNVNINNKVNTGDFKHNADRRGDVPYRDSKSREQYGSKQADGARDREAYRGKDSRDADRAKASSALADRGADPAAGREKLQGVDRDKATAAARDAPRDAGRDTGRDTGRGNTGADRAGAAADRAGNGSNRSGAGVSSSDRSFGGTSGASRGGSSGALSGVQNGSASRANADRGRASRSSMGSAPSAANRSAPSRPAGGGARAGGGGRR